MQVLIKAHLLAASCLLLMSCTIAPTSSPIATVHTTTAEPQISTTPTQSESPIPIQSSTPSLTPQPSRTPRPSPTLPESENLSCIPADGSRESGIVAGVIDGDTIKVQIGVQSFTIRYIGVDSPETHTKPPEPMGADATVRNRELVSGKRVTLISDPEVGNTDRYNRLLRYIVFDEVFVNLRLVEEGLARYYPGRNACGAEFLLAEQVARHEHNGIWALTPTPGQ